MFPGVQFWFNFIGNYDLTGVLGGSLMESWGGLGVCWKGLGGVLDGLEGSLRAQTNYVRQGCGRTCIFFAT